MSIEKAPPAFGAKLMNAEYFAQVAQIVSVLRGRSTLRTIANHLNSQNLNTPSGLTWDRSRLANFLKTNDITSIINSTTTH